MPIGLIMQLEEVERVARLERHFNTAKKLKILECQKCGFCCNKRPCITAPQELEEIAKFLGLSVEEIINTYFCVDRDKNKLVYVKPAGINQRHLIGKMLGWGDTYNKGKCIFLLDNNRCAIYEVRPAKAKVYECWCDYEDEEVNVHLDKVGADLVKAWSNKPLKSFYQYGNAEDMADE